MRRATIAALLLAGTALAAATPTAEDIRSDAETRGILRWLEPTPAPLGGLSADGTCFGGDRADVLDLDRPVGGDEPFLRDRAYVCRGLGTYWIRRDDMRLFRPYSLWYGPVPLHGVAGTEGLSRRILDDLAARGAEFPPLGREDPPPGPNGELPPSLEDGGVLVVLDVAEAGAADTYTDVAYVDPDAWLYWANRSGGFAGISVWAGPFPLPVVRDAPPSEVVPASLRVRKRAKTRKITIRRDLEEGFARVRRRDYAPSDFDLGAGVEVRRVLRANGHRIRLRVRVHPDAPRGLRDVTVKGVTGDDLLNVR